MTRQRAGQPSREQRRTLFCFGFHPWKHRYVRSFLASEGAARFPWSVVDAKLRGFGRDSAIVVWGTRERVWVDRLAALYGTPIWRMEDGFLRSVGLGAERYTPASLVLDRRGIYYDPTTPSDLECILRDGRFDTAELERARALRGRIVALAVSKYNVGDSSTIIPGAPAGKRTVLVPGQVEDDASIRLGCVDVRTNLELLRAARASRPDAFIVFKPHPDVVSGNRMGAVPASDAACYADVVIEEAPLPACLARADEVHTMTSLVGFEALMRGLEVHCYGLPFYAGWGLTHDRLSHPRRSRRLSLDELVAGVLLRYPIYRDPETLRESSPEAVVDDLARAIRQTPRRPIRKSSRELQARKFRNAVRAIFPARGD